MFISPCERNGKTHRTDKRGWKRVKGMGREATTNRPSWNGRSRGEVGRGQERERETKQREYEVVWMLNIDRVARLQKQPPPL